MTTWLFVVLIPVQADDLTNRFDRELSAILRWEILWGQLPNGSLVTPTASTRCVIQLTNDRLSYCSHDLGVCETYRIGEPRNWEAIAGALCKDKLSDEDALRAYVGLTPRGLVGSASQPAFGSGRGGFTGTLAEGSGMIWATTLHLGSRPEIIQQYRRIRPPELGPLQKWIRARAAGEHGLRVTVPCFASSDPSVFLSVAMPGRGREIETVFWNRQVGGWESADGFGPPLDPAASNRIRAIIELIPCSTVVF